MSSTHKAPHPILGKIRGFERRVPWWPMLGLLVLALSLLTYYQMTLNSRADSKRDKSIEALTVALTAEQNAKKAEGQEPVAPAPSAILDDPGIVQGAPGEPGKNGLNGRDGRDGSDGIDGRDGQDGRDGDPGTEGTPGTDGPPGEPGTDGVDGEDGKDGAPGEKGEKGDKGDTGPAPSGWTWTYTDPLGLQTTYNCKPSDDNPTYYVCKPQEST